MLLGPLDGTDLAELRVDAEDRKIGAHRAAGLRAGGERVADAGDREFLRRDDRAGIPGRRDDVGELLPAAAAAGREEDGGRERRGERCAPHHNGTTVGEPMPNWICNDEACKPAIDGATWLWLQGSRWQVRAVMPH